MYPHFYRYTNKDIIELIKKSNKSLLIDSIEIFIQTSKNELTSGLYKKQNNEENSYEKNLFTSGFYNNIIISNFIIVFFMIFKEGKDTVFNQPSISPQLFKIFNNSLLYLEILEYKIIKEKLIEIRQKGKDNIETNELINQFFIQNNILFDNNKLHSEGDLKGKLSVSKKQLTLIIDFTISLVLLLVLFTIIYNSISPYWNIFIQNLQFTGSWSTSSWIKKIKLFLNPKSTTSYISGFLTTQSSKYDIISSEFYNTINERAVLYNIELPDEFASSLLERISNNVSRSIYVSEFNLKFNYDIHQFIRKKVFEQSMHYSVIVCNNFVYLSSLILLNIYNPNNKIVIKENNILSNYNKIILGITSHKDKELRNIHQILSDTQILINENSQSYEPDTIYNYNINSDTYKQNNYKDIIEYSSSGESSQHDSTSIDCSNNSNYTESDSEATYSSTDIDSDSNNSETKNRKNINTIEPESEPEPNFDIEPEPESNFDIKPEPETDFDIEPENQTELKPEPDCQSELEPESQLESNSESESKNYTSGNTSDNSNDSQQHN